MLQAGEQKFGYLGNIQRCNIGFKRFITFGWIRLKRDVYQGLIGAKNAAHQVWDATKKVLIGTKNFAANPKAVGFTLRTLTQFVTAFNPILGAATSIEDKLEMIGEQFALGELKPQNSIGGSSTAQAAVDSRGKSHNWIPFCGV